MMEEDTEWMLQAQAGDKAAFESLVRKHQKPVLNFFYRFFGNAAMAEDAAQQLFLQLYRSLPDYKPQSKFTTYLYRMARNLAVNVSRRNAFLKFFSLEEQPESAAFSGPDSDRPEKVLEENEKAAQVRAALAGLSARQRMAVILAYFEDCSADEIAARLECSRGAVESMLFRAKKMLMKSLEKSRLLALLIGTLAGLGLCVSAPSVSGAESLLQSHDAAFVLLVLPRPSTGPAAGPQDFAWTRALEANPDLRLTVALSPADLAQLQPLQTQLREWVKAGNLEPVLRLSGDPVLPLIYDLDLARMFFKDETVFPSGKIAWQEDVTGPIVRAKMEFKSFFGEVPAGFVPGGGSLSLSVAEFLKKQKFLWTCAGFPESEWPQDGCLLLQKGAEEPFAVFEANRAAARVYSQAFASEPALEAALAENMWEVQGGDSQGVPVLVFDEARFPVPLEKALAVLGQKTYVRKMILGSEARRAQVEATSLNQSQIWPHSWPWVRGAGRPRGPGLTAWMGDGFKNAAWDILIQAHKDYQRYKNSGNAQMDVLDEAVKFIHQAESGTFFEWFGEADGADAAGRSSYLAEIQARNETVFKQTLAKMYGVLNLPLPEIFRRPLTQGEGALPQDSQSSEDASVSGGSPAPGTREVLPEEDDGFLVRWRPAVAGETEEPERPASVRLEQFDVYVSSSARNGDEIHFRIGLAAKPEAAYRTEIYIDINRRPGAGKTELLAARNGRVGSRDGWEFVLVNEKDARGSWQSRLYRAGSPRVLYTADMAQARRQGGVSVQEVRIPARLFGEKPSRWGYLACVLENGGTELMDFTGSENYYHNLKSSAAASGVLSLPMLAPAPR